MFDLIQKFFKKRKAQKIEDETMREKELATIDGEPWVDVLDITFTDPRNPRYGEFTLDWNKAFIEQLVEAGYSGRDDAQIIDQWFTDLCRGIAEEANEHDIADYRR